MESIEPESRSAGLPVARSAAEPLTFNGTVGLFTRAEGDARPIAVLFTSAWGLEEMCSRKFFRVIAERLADQGIASLRFDYPGTGDALDETAGDEKAGSSTMQSWCDAFTAANRLLQSKSGSTRIVVIAQGIGAMIATQAAGEGCNIEAVAYLAPVIAGRSYIRELSVLSKMIDDRLRLKPAAEGAIAVAGLSMPQDLADELKRINLTRLDKAAADRAMVFCRADRAADASFAEHLRQLHVDVTEAAFDNYDKLASNPTIAIVPETVVTKLVTWVSGLAARDSGQPGPPTTAFTSSHGCDGYIETVTRFGRNTRLFGILCAPQDVSTMRKPTVLLVSAGYDRLSGWGRSTVELARILAKAGISSLRFDCANVADSPPVAGGAGQILYTDAQLADMREAVDYLEETGLTPVVAAGRCSGAYLGLQSALRDPRIVGLVAVNPVVFQWQEGRSVDAALEQPVQTLEHYRMRFLELQTLKRIFSGKINVFDKSIDVAKGMVNHTAYPLIGALGGISRRQRSVLAGFSKLKGQGTRLTFLYGERDVGLEELHLFFGRNGRGMKRFGNMTVSIVPDTDHNFSPKHARTAYLEAILSMVAAASS